MTIPYILKQHYNTLESQHNKICTGYCVSPLLRSDDAFRERGQQAKDRLLELL